LGEHGLNRFQKQKVEQGVNKALSHVNLYDIHAGVGQRCQILEVLKHAKVKLIYRKIIDVFA
jgi:hypothetical protein